MEKDGVWYGDVTVNAETEKALLVEYEGEEEWVPKSQIHDDSELWENCKGETGKLALPLWFAKKLGWVEE
jgi:hypothetical protein